VATTVGVAGHSWRGEVTPWGAVVPWDGSATLDWYIAADDRWHVPSKETAVRQVRIGGTPVVATRVRIPSGDAVHRTWTVADAGGHTVVEVHNDSPLPIAVAFGRADLRTGRPPTDIPIQGIDLPRESTIVVPIGHRSSVTVALAHNRAAAGPLPPTLSTAESVVNGWRATSDRASRLDLPDVASVEAVVTARCEMQLAGPADPVADPAGFVLGVAELVRMGERPDVWVADVAAAAADAARQGGGADVDAALAAAAMVFHRASEHRARRDVENIATKPAPAGDDEVARDGIRAVAAVERRLASDGRLLPRGLPSSWLGVGFECHGVQVGPASTISFAVRWHGARPAVLWEVTGEPIELTAPVLAPGWRTEDAAGETLWPAPEPVLWPP